jgi:hypothetical protein
MLACRDPNWDAQPNARASRTARRARAARVSVIARCAEQIQNTIDRLPHAWLLHNHWPFEFSPVRRPPASAPAGLPWSRHRIPEGSMACVGCKDALCDRVGKAD